MLNQFNYIFMILIYAHIENIKSDGIINENGICFERNCPHICTSWRIDAVMRLNNGTIFIFKGYYFWLLHKDSIVGPKNISEHWHFNSTNGNVKPYKGYVDAALIDDNENGYFFRKNKIWTFNMRTSVNSMVLNKLVNLNINSIDAALLVKRGQKLLNHLYIFEGDNYFHETFKTPDLFAINWTEIFEHPIRVSEINLNFPNTIDAAYSEHNYIVITKGPQYTKFLIKDFPNNLKDLTIKPMFVYKDVYKCTGDSYNDTKFMNYDNFLFQLIKKELEIQSETSKPMEVWVIILIVSIGIIIGAFATIVIKCTVNLILKRRKKTILRTLSVGYLHEHLKKYNDIDNGNGNSNEPKLINGNFTEHTL